MTYKALKIQILFVLTVGFFLAIPALGYAQGEKSPFQVTGYPIPRFVTLSSDKVFMRSGPGTKYPVLWEYKRKGLPVEIIMEFDVWRKIKDKDGEQGWVHKTLLSGRRAVMANGNDLVAVKRSPDDNARLMAYMEPNAIMMLDECTPVWCKVEAQGYSGWTQRKFLWGIYETETIN